MGKKKQADFTKNQLKPGRGLPRKRNATNISFKSKKIIVPRKKGSSQKSSLSIPDCLKAIKSGTTPGRTAALNKLSSVGPNQRELFLPYVVEVFESVIKLLLDPDDSARKPAVKILENILRSDETVMKISSFIPLLINTLSCGMTNSVFRIKDTTLTLLMFILKHQPLLICKSRIILKNFYSMITGSPRKLYQSKNVLPAIYDNRINSEDYRLKVLECKELFLKEMLRNFDLDNVFEGKNEEQEVYWNCESPLYLQIYAYGGLKPVDIERSLSYNFSSQELNFDDPSIIDDFIIPVVNLIPGIFKEEISSFRKDDDIQLPLNCIKSLKTLLQILCHITDWIKSEWMQIIPCEEVDSMISNFLQNEILEARLFPFHQIGMLTMRNKNTDLIQLNLAVCYLHGKFLRQVECSKDKYISSIFAYMKNLFRMSYEDKYEAVPMLLKILKIYYSWNNVEQVSKFIVSTLDQLSSLLKIEDDRYNKKVLLSLFIKFSLHPAYDFLKDSVAMRQWFTWLLSQVTSIPKTGKVDKNILQVAKKIANRKHPHFLKALAKIDDNEYKAMLKYDNSDVTDAAIFLIYNRKEISTSLFEDISNVILLDTSFHTRYAIRLISLLTYRYTEKHQSTYTDVDINGFNKGRVDFIQFLLNIAVDSLNVTNKKWFDYDANEYTKAIEPFKDVAAYNIFPSLRWKEHSKLFEVCQKSLSLMPQKLVNTIIMQMFSEILDLTRNFPMHCAIAMLKLQNFEIKDRNYRVQIEDFIFSTLLTTSVLTQMPIEDEWYKCNVAELNMTLTRRLAHGTLQRQLENMEEMDGISVYHILRICKLYLDKGFFKTEDGEKMVNILEGFKEKCTDKTFKQQPLFVQLYNIFYFYA